MGWFYLLGSGGGLEALGCWGFLFAASSGDGNHLPGQEDLSPIPGSASPISHENLAPLLSSASISGSRGVGGCFAWCCAVLQFGTGSLGSSWDFTLGKWNQCKDPSLCSFIQPKHGLSWELVFRWASSTKGLCTVMVLFSTLAPPCQILLQWGQPRSGWGWIPVPARGKQKTTHTSGPLGTQNLAIVAQNPVETQICPGSCQQEQPRGPKNRCSTSP